MELRFLEDEDNDDGGGSGGGGGNGHVCGGASKGGKRFEEGITQVFRHYVIIRESGVGTRCMGR